MKQHLCIEEPYRPERYLPWDEKTKEMLGEIYDFVGWDFDDLERGDTVFKGDTSFSLEDADID